ncbi:MAG TPA: nodulation protein NfeD, partial [Oceanithermus sp.]|nr:nodulation protein NfeD [Oceanithermus sp.]
PGTVGLVALGLYFLGGYLAGMSGVLEVLLFFAGVLLLLAEIFLIPGFGVAGIGGIAAILASIYFTFGNQTLYVASLAVLLVTAGLLLAVRFLPRTRTGRALVLDSAIAGEAPPEERLKPLEGAIGKALTPLRPAGVAQFGERKVDVVAEGEFIEKGSAVRVVRVEGVRVVVRKED